LETLLIFLISAGYIVYKIAKYASRRKTITRKGAEGELRVSMQLDDLSRRKYLVLNDVLIQAGNRTSQIDHIIVSRYGIFVIETKNFSGWIHGHENSEYWMQTFYKKKRKFRNPVKQNQGHINALKKILSEFDSLIYHSIIVFSDQVELKNVYSDIPIVYEYQLLDTIKRTRRRPHLSREEMKSIVEKINEFRLHGKREEKEHIYNVNKYMQLQKERKSSSLCPWCGASLALKQGKYGSFYGCIRFPKCRYTKKA